MANSPTPCPPRPACRLQAPPCRRPRRIARSACGRARWPAPPCATPCANCRRPPSCATPSCSSSTPAAS
ncbi:potassium-transporting ATPase B chain domain protein [Bordetella holmesii ATCC 51541]|nr:potassium-transporting ATPase B chain domain protein [Bordetella holmesii ATCC 51541]